MLRVAIAFLVFAIVAGALGLGGVAELSMNVAYGLGVFSLILFVIHFIMEKNR